MPLAATFGVIDADHHRPVGDEAAKNQPQQAVANLGRVPAGAVEHLMIPGEVTDAVEAHDTRCLLDIMPYYGR